MLAIPFACHKLTDDALGIRHSSALRPRAVSEYRFLETVLRAALRTVCCYLIVIPTAVPTALDDWKFLSDSQRQRRAQFSNRPP